MPAAAVTPALVVYVIVVVVKTRLVEIIFIILVLFHRNMGYSNIIIKYT